MSDHGLILLAAGGASRMGRPKQLLPLNGVTLLRRAAVEAVAAGCSPIVVVIGAAGELAAHELENLAVLIEPNPQWQRGMGTSLRAGLRRALAAQPDLRGVMVMLCDQPHITAAHLQNLCEMHDKTGKGIIASTYADTFGPPCLFSAAWFDALLHLDDTEGAKRLIASARDDGDDLEWVSMPMAVADVDTPEDYERLRRE